MKKRIMSIFSTSFLLFILIVSVFIVGCATTPVTKFDSSQLNSDIDQIMELGGSDCKNTLQDKTIFINITVSQEEPYFLEDVDFFHYKIKKFKYEGDIGTDIEAKLKNALINDCGARIVDQIDQADISITSHVEKHYSQITKIDKVGSGSTVSLIWITPEEKSVPCRVEAATILSIDNKINDQNWKYNHLLSLKHDRISKVKRQGLFTLLGRVDNSMGMSFVVDYDNEYTVATAKFASTSGRSFVGGILVIPSFGKRQGSLDIYDIDTMQVKKHFAFEKGELSFSQPEIGPTLSLTHMIVKDKASLKCKYVELFLSTPGNLKYLIYDYIKELIRKVSKLTD